MASLAERIHPASGRRLASVAGGLLFGRALICGAGELYAADVANRHTDELVLIENDRSIVQHAKCAGRLPGGYTIVETDVRDFDFGHKGWDSIFFNIFPVTHDMAGLALPIAASLRPGGRLVSTPSCQLPMVWPTELLTIEQEIHVCPSEPFYPCLRTYRARPWPGG